MAWRSGERLPIGACFRCARAWRQSRQARCSGGGRWSTREAGPGDVGAECGQPVNQRDILTGLDGQEPANGLIGFGAYAETCAMDVRVTVPVLIGEREVAPHAFAVNAPMVDRDGAAPHFGGKSQLGGQPVGCNVRVRVRERQPSRSPVPGYQAAVNTQLGPGSSVAIFGAGPVGLMAALSARFLGAEKIFMVDHSDYRLRFAQETYGVIPIDFDEDDDPTDTILKGTEFHGVDATIDAVGFEAKGSALETALTAMTMEGSSGKALRQCLAATRRGGVVSVPGVYAGFIRGFLFGDAFDKGLTFKMGQTHAQLYML